MNKTLPPFINGHSMAFYSKSFLLFFFVLFVALPGKLSAQAPAMDAVAKQTVCNGANTAVTNFTSSSSGTISYTWVNNNPSIGLAAAGVGNVPSFVGTNSGTAPNVGTVTVTPINTVVGVPVTQTFNYTGALQTFTVPAGVTSITITANGAQGGTVTSSGGPFNGGKGASMKGDFVVTPGDVLQLVVGGKGNPDPSSSGGGGGSGVNNNGTALIVAGGGAGIDFQQPTAASINATTASAGIQGSNSGGAGGTTGGKGGDYTYAGSNTSRGGNGWNNGNSGSTGLNGTSSVTTTTNGTWGLGGGGGSVGAGSCNCGGGGGGYSGGGSGNINASGGGGGSINTGTNQINIGGVNTGDGTILLTYTPLVAYPGSTTSFDITVNPTATVTTVANQTVANNTNTAPITFNSPTTGGTIVYNWVNNTPSIGLPANGAGNIAAFNAVNTTAAPVTSTITVTPSYTNDGTTCTGMPATFTITVKPTPIITFNTTALTYGDAPLPLTATSTNMGTPITYSIVSGPGTIDGSNNLTTTGAGVITVQASQVASSIYGAATATQTFTVAKRAITVTAAAKNKTYGDTDPPLTYAITSGTLVGTDAFTGAIARDAGEAVTTYAIKQNTLTLSSNYTLTYVGANFTINKKALTITAVSATKTYGSANPTLTATYSGFVNSETSAVLSTAPAITTTATTTSGVGTYAITATGAAASNYTITYTAGTLTVTPAGLNITAVNQTKVYGSANPTLAVTYSGFVNSETSAVLTTQPTITTTAVTGSPVGTYPITATGAVASNYTITYTAGTLTVTPAGLNITASNQTKTYGAANPALAVTYSGFVGTDNAASLTTQPSVSTTATASSAAGTYPITATGAASANYTITYTAGTLTVNKAGLIITAANQTKVYGAALPALTVTYSGFVNGDTNTSALSTQAAISTTGTATSAVGTYPITATGAVSSNYTITYTAGTLTVTQAALNIAAINATKVYGSANPALAVTYSGFVNGDDATKLTTQPAITTTATASSAVGTYPITATGAVNPNYSITYTAATLTVTQAPLVITANNISRNYGQPNPTLTATYTGLVNGDTNSSLTTQPTITTTATITSLPGTYPITVSGAAGANYSISYVAGTFRVIPLTNANLSNLTISNGILSPAFATGTFSYTTSIANSISNVTVIPTSDPTATIVINGSPVNNGSPFAIDMAVGYNTISTVVTAQDGTTKLTYTITVYRAVPPDAVFATNILTPNGDGKNDTWTIKDILLYPNNTVKVFDRAGRIVFAQHSYANTWDGTLSGSPLTEGTYYYAIDLGIFGAQPIKGYISILRKR